MNKRCQCVANILWKESAPILRPHRPTAIIEPNSIVDNLNIHWSAGLVEWVAAKIGFDGDLGIKGRRGILKSQASRRGFLSSLDHRIRFVYTPKHSSWLNQIEIVFGIINRKVMRRGNFKSVADLEEQLRMFIAYHSRTMAHPFEWT